MQPGPTVSFPGPGALGRGIVVQPGVAVPDAFATATRIRIDDAALEAPAAAAAELHGHWIGRTRVVVELAVTTNDLRRPQRTDAAPYSLPPDFEFGRERLHFLVWANNYDARGGTPVWWHARKAERLGVRVGGAADVSLPDGRPAWCDGGPRGPVTTEHPIIHRESIEAGELRWTRTPPEPHEDLAPDQLAAVSHSAGPARIIAPAGSGKTRTLTARLRHLLTDRRFESQSVTALAYNAKAAAELQERIGDVPSHVRTIHSFGNWVVARAHGEQRVLAESEVRDIVGRLAPVRVRANQDVLAPYLEALGQIRIGLRRPEVVEDERDDVPGLAELFPRYRDVLRERQAIDHDEQIYGAIEALLRDPDLRRAFQHRARHLLVDEFQDLTPSYLLLIRLIAAPEYQVFGVGDDDQVIYGYAGADPGFLIEFDRLFPGADHYALHTNYRSPPAVVTAASTLLGYNRRRIDKRIEPAPDRSPEAADLILEHVPAAGLAEAAQRIVAAWLDEGVPVEEVAILARVNDALLPVQLALEAAGFPYVSTVGPRFLQRTGVRAALAYVRIGLAPEEIRKSDLFEVLKRPTRRLGKRIRRALGRRTSWSIESLRQLEATLDDVDVPRLERLVADLERVAAAARRGSAMQAIRVIRHTVGLERAVALLDGSRTAADRSGHGDDLDALEQAAALHDDVATFEAWLQDLLNRPRHTSGVALSTVHRVKGREWPRVVVFRADRRLFPHRLAEDVEEERRVFHVAVTRGRDRVAVLADADQPSRFLAELTRPAPAEITQVPLPPPPHGVVARPGDTLVAPGGYPGTVVEVGSDSVFVEIDGGTVISVDYGERVTAGERSGPLAPPPAPVAEIATDDDPSTEALFALLRAWRLERARAAGVPAYVVLNDKHLRVIARRRPATPEALLDCPGIGPTKLDRYGEDILDVIEAFAGGEVPVPDPQSS